MDLAAAESALTCRCLAQGPSPGLCDETPLCPLRPPLYHRLWRAPHSRPRGLLVIHFHQNAPRGWLAAHGRAGLAASSRLGDRRPETLRPLPGSILEGTVNPLSVPATGQGLGLNTCIWLHPDEMHRTLVFCLILRLSPCPSPACGESGHLSRTGSRPSILLSVSPAAGEGQAAHTPLPGVPTTSRHGGVPFLEVAESDYGAGPGLLGAREL